MPALFRYVITDMDGTLLSSDHLVSDYTRDTLKILVHQYGVTLIVATGRSYSDVRVIAENLQRHIWGDDIMRCRERACTSLASAPAFYLLTSNGAVVHNGITHEVLFHTAIDPTLAEQLFRMLPCDEEVVNTNAYQHERWVCRINWPEMMNANKESGFRFFHIENPPPLLRDTTDSATQSAKPTGSGIETGDYTGITKIFFISDDANRLRTLAEEVQGLVDAKGGSAVSLTFSTTDCLDIMAEGVTKGKALKNLFRAILPSQDNVDVVAEALAQSIAFGDGLNDEEMLTTAGKGCIMRNANPKLIHLHPELEVIHSNTDDGVAKKLRSVFDFSS